MLAIPPGLDPDILRAFVMIAEGSSVTRAAERVGRTQSAVSMQMRKLEDMLGTPLLARGARGLAPTIKGVWLAERARTLLSLHDEIHANFRAAPLIGQVRLGTPDDYALQWLPRILAGFAQSHPKIEVDVVSEGGTAGLRRAEQRRRRDRGLQPDRGRCRGRAGPGRRHLVGRLRG